jgi:drug/metabolite transporter (DMT)-like permease
MTPGSSPRLRLFAGAALISLSPVWVKLVSVSPTTSGFYRVLIGGVALTLYLAVTRKRPMFTGRVWSLLALAAAFFALDLWFWHRSIIYIGPGLSTLLANFQVFILMLVGILFLGQKPAPQQLVAIPLALVGLGMIVGFDWQSLPGDYRLGVIFGLLTAICYAGYLLTMRFSREAAAVDMPTREIAVVSLVSAALLGLSAIAEGQSLAVTSTADLGWLAAYGILSHCLGYLLIVSSLPQVSTTEAGLALLLQPTLSFVWDVVFFARPMTPLELTGAAIAIGAIYLGSRKSSKQVQGSRE